MNSDNHRKLKDKSAKNHIILTHTCIMQRTP